MGRIPNPSHRLKPGRRWLAWALAASFPALPAGAADAGLAGALAEVGLEAGDLALGAPPDGLGHPAYEAIPYLLPHVRSVHEDPRRLLALAGNLLRPVAGREAGERSLQALWTVFALQPRWPGFRGMALPVREVPDAEGALTAMVTLLQGAPDVDALAAVDHLRPLAVRPWPEASAAELALPESLRRPVARWLGGLWQAGVAIERSWRHLPPATLERAVLASEVPRLLAGGTVWWPALADAARLGDGVERAYAGLLVLAGLEILAGELAAVPAEEIAGFDRWQASTPWGRVILAGPGDHRHACNGDCLAIVDLGGDDLYEGTVAAAILPRQPVSVAVDLGGDDRYLASGGPSQGAGLGGVGMLYDLAGNDVYEAGDAAQGFGLLGEGLLWDGGGDDRFTAAGGAQGAAVFGAGLLFSAGGGDEYRILGEGQGFGGPGACGALVDGGGDDRYVAEPDAANAPGRADYHSGGRVAASNAQGAGVGRRGDLSDGQVWAGGVGVLVDAGGDDRYSAGNFAQGSGYWYGTGLLLDGDGDDVYRSVYFSQGSASHFGQGLLWDAGVGDDRHLLEQEAGASLGYGWDFALGVLVDGGGGDLYQGEDAVLGVAERSSVALFLELGGDDVYRLPEGARALGAVGGNPHAYRPGGPLRAASTAAAVGFFLDLGGEDRYPAEVEPCGRSPGDLRHWTCTRGNPRPLGVHLGAGVDRELPVPADLLEWLGPAERR